MLSQLGIKGATLKRMAISVNSAVKPPPPRSSFDRNEKKNESKFPHQWEENFFFFWGGGGLVWRTGLISDDLCNKVRYWLITLPATPTQSAHRRTHARRLTHSHTLTHTHRHTHPSILECFVSPFRLFSNLFPATTWGSIQFLPPRPAPPPTSSIEKRKENIGPFPLDLDPHPFSIGVGPGNSVADEQQTTLAMEKKLDQTR